MLHLTIALARKGHQIHVITSAVPGCPKKERLIEGVTIHRIGIPHPRDGTSMIASLFYFIHGVISLRHFATFDLDVLESNTYLPSYLGALFSAITKTPHIMTIHDVYLTDWKYRTGLLLAPIATLVEKFLTRLPYDRIVTVSQSSKKKLVTKIGFDESRIDVVPNGIPYKMIMESPISTKRYSMVFLGRLVPHKHVDHLIHAISLLKENSNENNLLIIGAGPERKYLEQLVEQLELEDSVSFAGFVSKQTEVYSLLKNADCLVNPSTVEGFGIAVLEAMATGAVPIVYDLPAYSDFVDNRTNALVVNPGDIEGLAKSIMQVITNDSLRERLSQHAMRTAKSFSWPKIGNSVIGIYKKAIEEKFQDRGA